MPLSFSFVILRSFSSSCLVVTCFVTVAFSVFLWYGLYSFFGGRSLRVISCSLSENRSVSHSRSMRNSSLALLSSSVSQVSMSEMSAASRPSAVSEVAAIWV